MHCKQWQKMLPAFQGGLLDPPAAKRLEQHIAHCSACSQALQQQQMIVRCLQQEPKVKAPANFNAGVWRKIGASAVSPAPSAFRWLPLAGSLAGTLAAAAILIVVTSRELSFITPAPRPPLMAEKEKPATQARTLAQKETGQPSEATTLSEPEYSHPATRPQKMTAEEARARTMTSPLEEVKKLTRVSIASVNASAPPVRPETNVRPAALAAGPEKVTYASQAFAGVRFLNNKININQGERCRLEFSLATAARVDAKIYTREGRMVKTLVETELMTGPHFLEWDGTKDNGQKVASGIYILILKGTGQERKFKIAVIK